MHLDSGQMLGWQPAAQEKHFSPAALPPISVAARERSLALAAEAHCRSTTRAPERRRPRCQCQKRRQLSLNASYAAAGLLPQEADPAWRWSYWTDKVRDHPRSASLGSAPPPCCPAATALRVFALGSARVGTLDRSRLRHPQIPKASCADNFLCSLTSPYSPCHLSGGALSRSGRRRRHRRVHHKRNLLSHT